MSADVDATQGDPAPTRPVIAFGPAVATWAIAWVIGGIVLGVAAIGAMRAVFGAATTPTRVPPDMQQFYTPSGGALTVPQVAVVALVGWATFLVALGWASTKYGTGDVVADLAVRVRLIDLVAIPIGVVTQLVLVPALYVPLQGIWPDAFSDEQLERRAQDLADRAGGWQSVLLVVIVVIGAPVVEELVYRGLIQRSATALIGVWPGLVMTAAWFAIIHFSPVEYPGLFVAGLVFGGCVVATGRIGPAILAHASFNAVGILVVLS